MLHIIFSIYFLQFCNILFYIFFILLFYIKYFIYTFAYKSKDTFSNFKTRIRDFNSTIQIHSHRIVFVSHTSFDDDRHLSHKHRDDRSVNDWTARVVFIMYSLGSQCSLSLCALGWSGSSLMFESIVALICGKTNNKNENCLVSIWICVCTLFKLPNNVFAHTTTCVRLSNHCKVFLPERILFLSYPLKE